MMPTFRAILLVLVLCAPLLALGQAANTKTKPPVAPVITGEVVDSSNRASIFVAFDYPIPKVDDLPKAEAWEIYQKVVEEGGTPRIEKLTVDAVDASMLATSSTVLLKLKIPVSKDARSLDITLITATYILHLPAATLPARPADEGGPKLEGSKGKSDSDIYFNGSYAATEGSGSIYDIDAFAGYMEGLQKGKKYYGELGAYGQVRTKQSTTVSPNSFQVYGVYQRLLSNGTQWKSQFQIPYLNFRFAGLEFDLSGKQLNFVTSPVLTLPVRLSGKTLGRVEPGFTVPHMVFTLGPEFVNVGKSALAPTGQWHTRGLFGASFAAGYEAPEPKKLFESLQLSSSYQVRLPSSPEIFYDDKFATTNPLTGKMVTPPRLGTQPRHFVDTTICYNLVKWVGVTFENTYGSLPPAFTKTDATYTVGLSFTLKQTSYGRYSILRP